MDWGEGAIWRPAVALAAALLALLALASSAGAVVVNLPDGQALGVTPRAGVAPASVPGARKSAALANVADNGIVNYQGGPVMHSSAPYLIFWDPASDIPTPTETLMRTYLTDVSLDSGLASNVFGVLRQYSDHAGISDYQQTFSGGQAFTDTHAFPGRDVNNCVNHVPADESACITDTQLRSELTRFIAANSLPTAGATNAGELVPNAPIYLVVMPPNVNVCAPLGCADTKFCAYHSSYVDGANRVLYAPIPLLDALVSDPANGLDPKSCQADNNPAVQQPNGDGGDVALKYLSHELSETITDPLLNAWFDSTSGNEVGDNCNFWDGGPTNIAGGDEPSAFEPTMGGTASDGTLYDQLINGDKYYTQSEWSNGDADCQMEPSSSTLTPSFTVPPGAVATGSSVSFDPSATSSSGGYSSIGWTFGDGGTSFVSTATRGNLAPASISHTYMAPGVYTVSVSMVDTHGNVATTSNPVTVDNPPSAGFSASTMRPLVGSTVSFDGSGSSDPNGGALISTYQWSFGDGGTATGATPSHLYSAAGVHTTTLTVTDSLGLSASVSKQIEVLTTPVAAFRFAPMAALSDHPVAFTAADSSDPNAGGQIDSYAWSFGDGATATGVTTSHTYRAPGIYTAHLTVADSFGLSTSVTQSVLVTAPRPPTSSPGSLSGLAKRKPKLSFELLAGVNAPGLQRVTVGLPGGLSFAGKRLTRGISVKGTGGRQLSFTAKLTRGKLTIALGGAARDVKVTIAGPALTASRQLARRVTHGTVKALTIAVTALDSAGTSTSLRLTPKL
jgi:PKD repeat protein